MYVWPPYSCVVMALPTWSVILLQAKYAGANAITESKSSFNTPQHRIWSVMDFFPHGPVASAGYWVLCGDEGCLTTLCFNNDIQRHDRHPSTQGVAKHQIRHQTTTKKSHQPGDCRSQLDFPQASVWVCMG